MTNCAYELRVLVMYCLCPVYVTKCLYAIGKLNKLIKLCKKRILSLGHG